MKLPRCISRTRRQAGMFLVECLVYIAVFAILLGVGTGAFYFCWNHSEAVICATDDIASALHTGERWRADVRSATGKITVETNPTGQVIRIPEGKKQIVYRFNAGEIRRQDSTGKPSQLLLSRVSASQMETELRGGVNAWRWELELAQRRRETQLPLRFTFEAAQMRP